MMGLDTTHDCWHGPYSSFSEWRHAVALAAGYEVWPVKYGDGITRDCIMLDWGHLGGERHLLGEWEETPPDPLLVLFVHHDHAGAIHPAQCAPLADALEAVLPRLTDGPGFLTADVLVRATRRFMAGLRAAAAAGESVEFG